MHGTSGAMDVVLEVDEGGVSVSDESSGRLDVVDGGVVDNDVEDVVVIGTG